MKVVQIYGASFCGSTMLDLMLGNCENCLSCGEVYALFRDGFHERNVNVFWTEVRALGKKNLYHKLFTRYGYKLIVDSSKVRRWLRKRGIEAKNKGIPVHEVVMFKSPEGWVGSMLKRDNVVHMNNQWVKTYDALLKDIPDATYLEYRTLATNPAEVLEKLCERFDIPYFPGKERYWESPNTQIFGNANARNAKALVYSEDRSHREHNTKSSNVVYEKLKKKEKTWLH